ncbi:MAG: hypothetical protein NW206_19690 [Hyphomonadaceae bacterium]|nr:hypothetical protein [Hyphomonadaceae bacterium]
MDAQAQAIFAAAAAGLGSLWRSTFGADPILWTVIALALVAVTLAGQCFSDHRGWAGSGWLALAVALYLAASPVQSWAKSQDNRPPPVQNGAP